ncbi:YihY/virulence factor BrkB family protein [Histidinibacterium lentulum]|uniref:YihY/virulence factor BrkB family protein n=1 Tax=Histidinibacterium lentulum TaxID=2480588 RepID=A0A3N2R8J6_9RHOB|nr:YihY/virulence factor BrkB family protein [Histidinibacterium lentulum]ROU03747.1 YihY/virulence factor BrkB family protein [Histidinibacterium lentulum]
MATESDRGRDSRRPTQMPREGWKDILARTGRRIGEDHVSVMAGGIAFFGLVALVPALAAVISIAGILYEPGVVTEQIAQAGAFLPQDVVDILQSQAAGIASRTGGGLGLAALAGLLLSLYSASRGVNNLIEGINLAYNENETRGLVLRNLVALALTLLLATLAILAMGALVLTPALLSVFGFTGNVELLVTLGSYVLLALAFMVSLGVIYRYAPARRPAKWSWVSLGAVCATAAWLAASALFSVYVTNFGSYNETYGALGGVIILLLWLWISCFVVLLGAQLNAETEHQTARDTTRGPDRPMGERGAYMADTLGAGRGEDKTG